METTEKPVRIVVAINQKTHARVKRFAAKQQKTGGRHGTIQSATEHLLQQGLKSLKQQA